MIEQLNTAGYDLYQLPNHPDLWYIDPKSTQDYFGSLKEVVVYMIKNLGFQMPYIEEAIDLLADNLKNEHNAVHFGAFKSPIFSFKKEVSYGKRAS